MIKKLVEGQERDANLWTESFMNHYASDLRVIDEQIMRAWFSCAMMAMHDSIYNNEIKTLKDHIQKLESLINSGNIYQKFEYDSHTDWVPIQGLPKKEIKNDNK